MDCNHQLITDEDPCEYSMEYESICGNGTVELLKDNQKIEALTYLMKQYTKESSFTFNEKMMTATAVFKLTVSEITGKHKK
jgi:nitroimidazol reductase NimA-like FMN-containing flavoprotein (pyridoxamine 5'-phosphate oxidase superfamily)